MTFPFPQYTPSAPATVEFTDLAESAANNAVYTFADLDAGAADADRYLAVAVTMSDDGLAAAATACTIGGQSATEAAGQSVAAASESNYAGVWIVKVPTGTTATVEVTGNTTMQSCSVTLYRIIGIASATPTDTDTASSAVGGLLSMDLDVQSGGVAIGAGVNADQGTAASWVGLTEDDDQQNDNMRHTAASGAFSATAAASAITVTMGLQRSAAACAHWA
jgi:hypothetical protein